MIVDCPFCGPVPSQGLFGGNATVSISNVGTTCPRCGAPAPFRDGTYTLVNSVVSAFTASSVTKDQILRFREVARSVQAGTVSAREAESEIAKIGNTFAKLWSLMGNNGGQISLILTIITLFLMIHFERQSSADSAELADIHEKQVEATQTVAEIERKILEELQKQSRGTASKPSASPPTKNFKNRAQRRKAAAIERRQKK